VSTRSVPAPLNGRTILLTGGSGGIGAATARVLHRDGATVLLAYGANRTAAEALAAELEDRVDLIRADLAEPEGADHLWEAAATGRRVDVLVNNAGAWLASPVDDDDGWRAGWRANITLNLQSAADLSRRAVQHFRASGGGIVVNVTSRSAHRGDDGEHLAYGAAKGGLKALTKGIARAFGGDGVLAYDVAPGWVATDLAAGALAGEDVSRLPLGEPTPAADVAEVIAFLASGRSRHTTGATIDITGADYVR
jgi:3-oxoacyl-[acyl-carrier protein] reductase